MPKRMMDGMGRMGAEATGIEFTLPEGVALDGDSGEAVIEWERTPDGTIRILAIDGNRVGVEAEEETEPPEAEIDDMPA